MIVQDNGQSKAAEKLVADTLKAIKKLQDNPIMLSVYADFSLQDRKASKTAGFSRKDFEKALQKERKLKHYTKDTIEGIAYAMDQWAAHADLEDKDDLEGRETDLLNEIDENTGGDQEIDLYKDEKALLNVFTKVLKLSSEKGALNPLTKPELSRKASLADQKGQTKRTRLIKMAYENPELRSEILKKLAGSVNTQSFLQELLDSGDVTAPDEDYYGDADDFDGEDDPEQAAKDEYDRNMQDYLNTSSSTSGYGYTTINASDFPDGFDLQQGGSYGGDIVVWDSHSDAEEAAVKELTDMFESDPGTVSVEKMIDNGFLKNDDDAMETYIDEDTSNTSQDSDQLESIFEEELDEIREAKDEAEETLDQVRATIGFYGQALKELKRAEGTVKKELRARKIKGKPSKETKKWLDGWKKVFTAEADAEEGISDEWDKEIASLVPLSFSKNFVSKTTPDQYFVDAEEYLSLIHI